MSNLENKVDNLENKVDNLTDAVIDSIHHKHLSHQKPRRASDAQFTVS